MGLTPFLKFEPLPPFDQSTNPFAEIIPEDVLQLQRDACDVLEGRVEINTFEPDYQEKIKNYYRFDGARQNSKSKNIVNRTRMTLDIV